MAALAAFVAAVAIAAAVLFGAVPFAGGERGEVAPALGPADDHGMRHPSLFLSDPELTRLDDQGTRRGTIESQTQGLSDRGY